MVVRINKFGLIILLILIPLYTANAQNSEIVLTQPIKVPISLMSKPIPLNAELFKSKINYPILAAVGVSYSYMIYEINQYYANTWWKEDPQYIYDGSFHIVNDNTYARNIDKIGHAFGTNIMSHFFSAGFEASGLDEETSVLLGAIGGFGMQFYVEVKDGFAPVDKVTGKPKWGFSPGDAISNLLGAGYFTAKYYYPYLNNFQLRGSYFPSKALRDGDKPDNNFSDDYEGQKMWLSFRMKNLLPKDLSKYWPSFLMLSAGYFVSGIGDYSTSKKVKPYYYLALDFDVETIPLYGNFWAFVKNTLNMLHFPLPGIEFSEDGVSFVLIAY